VCIRAYDTVVAFAPPAAGLLVFFFGGMWGDMQESSVNKAKADESEGYNAS
jgi:hypothetical protein